MIDKEQLISDFLTGKFTVQQLGDLYGTNISFTSNILTTYFDSLKIKPQPIMETEPKDLANYKLETETKNKPANIQQLVDAFNTPEPYRHDKLSFRERLVIVCG
jgi:hypothetical protein